MTYESGTNASRQSRMSARLAHHCRYFCLGILVLMLSGCPQSRPTGKIADSQLLRGQELELFAPKSLNLPVIWEVLLQEWSSQTGATTRIVEFDPQAGVPQLSEPDAGTGGGMVLFPLNQLSEFDSKLSPILSSDTRIDTKDLFKGLRERVLSREGELIAYPISVPVMVCYYRQDLLRAARKKAPETWEEYDQLVGSLDTWAPGLVAVEPLGSEDRATTFFTKSLAFCKHPENYSVWFDIDSARPTLTSPGFVEALENARQTWARLPRETLTYRVDECRRMLLMGKAAMALAWEPQSSDLVARTDAGGTSPIQRLEGIEVGICRLPGSRRVFNRNSKKWDTIPAGQVHAPALCGFAGLAAGVRLQNTKGDSAASSLLISLSSSAMFDEAFAVLPKGPCRESQTPLAPTWFGPELSTEEASQYTDAVAQSLRDMQVVSELPLIGASEFRRATSDALEPLLRGEADTEQTLKVMQQSYEAIVDRLGRDAVRDSHRRGLGMSPPPRK